MDQPPARRRRIDRVTAPDLLDALGGYTPTQLRQLRDECREEESRLSYSRRVLQGQLDIARTERDRRAGGDDAETLIASLPSILADEPSPGPAREARTVTFFHPDHPEGGNRRADDSVLEMPSLSRLPDLADDDLADLIARLEREESLVSEARHAVLHNLDGLQAELVRRYREGSVDVDDILATSPLRQGTERHGG